MDAKADQSPRDKNEAPKSGDSASGHADAQPLSYLDILGGAAHKAQLFSEGVATGIALNPINSASEWINHLSGSRLQPIAFGNQKEVSESASGKAGSLVGSVVDFAALSLVAKRGTTALKLTGLSADVAASSIAGAVSDGVLTPDGGGVSNFWHDRAERLAMGGLMGASGALSGRLIGGAVVPGETLMRRSLNIALGASLGGAASAGTTEVASLALTGKHAEAQDLLTAAGIGAAGGAMGALGSALERKAVPSAERQYINDKAMERPPVVKADAPPMVHVSSSPNLVPRDVEPGYSLKPHGLWFSQDNNWSKTMGAQMPEIRKGHAFQLDLGKANMLDISTRAELDSFIAKFGIAPAARDIDKRMKYSSVPRETLERIHTDIDWGKVAASHDGVNFHNVNNRSMWRELSPTFFQDDRPTWFSSLDIDSGVVWNASKVGVKPVATP